MYDCCNPDCDGVSKMIRCGKCRRYKIYYCAAGCNTEVYRHFKVFCKECAEFSHLRWAKEYQEEYLKTPRGIMMRKLQNERAKNKRKLINNSIIISSHAK